MADQKDVGTAKTDGTETVEGNKRTVKAEPNGTEDNPMDTIKTLTTMETNVIPEPEKDVPGVRVKDRSVPDS